MLHRLVVLGIVACACGCGRSSNDRYIPSAPLAQDALKAALDSWASGSASAELSSGAPKIQLADSRREGTKLASYKILGEVSVDGGRRFDVLLNLTDPVRTEKTQYVVVGIDPLWVMRQEDYDMITHWDHPMPAETTSTNSPNDKDPAQGNSGGPPIE